MVDAHAHRVLVVEADEATREELREALAALGHSVRLVATVEEALAALEEEDFCYLVLDPHLPTRAGVTALEGGGERLLTLFRAADARRVEGDAHATPVFAVGTRTDHEHVGRMYELGATTYLAKPLGARPTLLRDKVLTWLARAGRADHQHCASLGMRVLRAWTQQAAVRVAIDGVTYRRKTEVLINETVRELQDARFASFLKLVSGHVRASGAWQSREAVGVVNSREAISRIRVAFRGLIPEGFEVIEGDGNRRFRLNPAIAVERVALEALVDHANADVRKVAQEMVKRSAKK